MSQTAPTPDDARLSELSRTLGVPARQLLIAAARLATADPQRANDPAYRQRVLQDARNESGSAEAAARLLLTPIGDYAINEVDRLFASIWPDITNRQDWAACESVQRNASSPGWRQGPFSPWETDVHAVMSAVARGYSTGSLVITPTTA